MVETKDINASFSDTRNLFFPSNSFTTQIHPQSLCCYNHFFYKKIISVIFYHTKYSNKYNLVSCSTQKYFFLCKYISQIQEINKILNHDENTGILRKHLHHKLVISCCLFLYIRRYTSKKQFRFQFCSYSYQKHFQTIIFLLFFASTEIIDVIRTIYEQSIQICLSQSFQLRNTTKKVKERKQNHRVSHMLFLVSHLNRETPALKWLCH